MTDQELISGIMSNDRQAVQFLVHKYHKQVVKTAFHFVHNMDDAEDLAQDVCIEILESAGAFRGNSALSTWIYRIAVNKSLNFVRKNKGRQLVRFAGNLFFGDSEAGSKTVAEPAAYDRSFADSERRIMVEKAINSLPSNQKTAFILHKYEDLPYREIAEIMKTSLPAVESLLQRAKQNLQKKLIVHFDEYAKK